MFVVFCASLIVFVFSYTWTVKSTQLLFFNMLEINRYFTSNRNTSGHDVCLLQRT